MRLANQRFLFRLSSELTDHLPVLGARVLDSLVLKVLTGAGARGQFAARTRAALEGIREVRRVLVLADIHLGDAVVLQSMVTAVRDFFPDALIDYVVSRGAAVLVEGNPEITRILPLYSGASLPSASDLEAVSAVCREGEYDLAINASPSFVPGNPFPKGLPVLDLSSHAPHLLCNENSRREPNHFLYQAYRFVYAALATRFQPVRPMSMAGVRLHLSDSSRAAAADFLDGCAWQEEGPVILLNPDTASIYTCPPLATLTLLVERLAERPVRILVGEGHTDRGVGCRLMARLSPEVVRQVRLIPASVSLATYTALTDLADVFISGDTGPLHWAAARKQPDAGSTPCRNRTFVVSLFGATPARMSGYDSNLPGYLPAWQDAPSAAFVSTAPCRNITCLNKLHKTCRVVRCFEGLDLRPALVAVQSFLDRPCDSPRSAWGEPNRAPLPRVASMPAYVA